MSIAADDARGTPSEVAEILVGARRAGRALSGYPGDRPATLAEAYAIQDAAIALWPDEIVGWKVGRIPDPWRERLGADRLMGPIFRRQTFEADGPAESEFQVFVDGFAAVEAEIVAVAGRDTPEGKTAFTGDEALELIGDIRIGIEPAGSPLPAINDMGPAVVVSDFGNNAGLILGPSVPGWREALNAIRAEVAVEGETVGVGGAGSLPGGPVEAIRFAVEALASRGRPLRAGQFISTGAMTGIHEVVAGQSSVVTFGPLGEMHCRAVAHRGFDRD